MYGMLLYGGIILAGLAGIAISVAALPPTVHDLWNAFRRSGRR